MERELVVRRTATKLHAAETGIEDAIVQVSELLSEIYQAKKDLGLAGTVAAEETQRVGRALAALQLAHGELVDTHHGLAAIARLIGLRVKMIGWKPSSQAEVEKSAAA